MDHLSASGNPALRMPFLVPACFSPAECERIIKRALLYPVYADPAMRDHPEHVPGAIGVRRYLNQEADYTWIWQRLIAATGPVNAQFYRFEINGIEIPHFCSYRPGQRADWHMDIADDQTTNRKLTLLVFLSDPASFEGGRFYVYPKSTRVDQSQGNLLIFPAYLMHKVEPVLSGMRYTLITWGFGPAFR
ncbi:MAG: 2OG-Fe(II) oxygenase [Candidatus Sericytochromatia bacterium]